MERNKLCVSLTDSPDKSDWRARVATAVKDLTFAFLLFYLQLEARGGEKVGLPRRLARRPCIADTSVRSDCCFTIVSVVFAQLPLSISDHSLPAARRD